MTEIAGKKQAVGLIGAERGETAQLRDADVLGFINHYGVERRMCAVCQLRGESAKQPRVGDDASGL